MKKRAGFAAIIGRPNVGKSTLLNRLVGEKIAGVSPKPQTTRRTVRGILTVPEGQIIFVDTPGFHSPQDMLGKWMAREIQKALEGIDLVYWLVLPEDNAYEEKILDTLRPLPIPVFLLINQIDRFPKPRILSSIEKYHRQFAFKEVIPISAKTGEQTDLLVQKTLECLPEGGALFPEDQISDQNERDLAGEIIREKLFRFTGEEIPYATAVMVDEFRERADGLIELSATVVVERDSQKAMVIGKHGQKMKEIGTAARRDIERLLGHKVFLRLWVKTLPHWKKDRSALKTLGYD
jgi:GTP-binding protein Era